MICAWNEARAALEGATCMWQDLDGLHCATAPATAPPTSIVWAWWPYPSDKVARLRIDEDIVYLAEAAWPSGSTPTIPWGADDRRVGRDPVGVGHAVRGRVVGQRRRDDRRLLINGRG